MFDFLLLISRSVCSLWSLLFHNYEKLLCYQEHDEIWGNFYCHKKRMCTKHTHTHQFLFEIWLPVYSFPSWLVRFWEGYQSFSLGQDFNKFSLYLGVTLCVCFGTLFSFFSGLFFLTLPHILSPADVWMLHGPSRPHPLLTVDDDWPTTDGSGSCALTWGWSQQVEGLADWRENAPLYSQLLSPAFALVWLFSQWPLWLTLSLGVLVTLPHLPFQNLEKEQSCCRQPPLVGT